VLDQGGEPVGVELALLPVGELEVQLTWQVAGMKGTGSDSYTAAGILVPRHRTLSMAELSCSPAGMPVLGLRSRATPGRCPGIWRCRCSGRSSGWPRRRSS
jgi:hypothetical protein